MAESLTKGQRVIVTGALRVRQFERQDGSKGTSVEMNVDEVGPSLKFATAKVTKATRSGSSGGGFGGSDPWSSGQPAQQAPAAADAWNTGGSAASGSTEEPPF